MYVFEDSALPYSVLGPAMASRRSLHHGPSKQSVNEWRQNRTLYEEQDYPQYQ